jgi:8-oxo-dGTP pyrophosphatase MutT (NUDIX family)
MEQIGSKTVWEGKIARVRIDEFRYPDGSTSRREVIGHPGAVALLELPAGKLDLADESPIDCAKRELGEEVGKAASEWRELKRFYTSPGFAEEQVIVYLATGLEDADAEPDAEERLEVVTWPLEDLDRAIEQCADAKSLIGLLLFRQLCR